MLSIFPFEKQVYDVTKSEIYLGDITAAQLPEELRALTVQNQFIRGQGVPVGRNLMTLGHQVIPVKTQNNLVGCYTTNTFTT